MSLNRSALFDVPLWTTQFDEVRPHHIQMAREVEHSIDHSDPNDPPRYLAHQTAEDPFLLPSPGWKLLEQLTNKMFSSLATTYFRRWSSGEFHLRRWAIRFGRLSALDEERLQHDGLHNHLPALFSAIYYLRLPDEFEGNPDGGTLFVNPLANLMDIVSPRTVTIAPREGMLLIFPSYLDHRPVPVRWAASKVPRIVVSIDIFYVSGKSSLRTARVIDADPAPRQE